MQLIPILWVTRGRVTIGRGYRCGSSCKSVKFFEVLAYLSDFGSSCKIWDSQKISTMYMFSISRFMLSTWGHSMMVIVKVVIQEFTAQLLFIITIRIAVLRWMCSLILAFIGTIHWNRDPSWPDPGVGIVAVLGHQLVVSFVTLAGVGQRLVCHGRRGQGYPGPLALFPPLPSGISPGRGSPVIMLWLSLTLLLMLHCWVRRGKLHRSCLFSCSWLTSCRDLEATVEVNMIVDFTVDLYAP